MSTNETPPNHSLPSTQSVLTNQFNESSEVQYTSQPASTYFPSENEPFLIAQQPPIQVAPTGMAFDLNAVGDEDEDVEGQMHQMDGADPSDMNEIDEVDRRSVFVGNVDYGATPSELQEHFKNCGYINRITIMIDRRSGHPKGYAYIEFKDESAIPNAVSLSESMFRDRQLKVTAKRKNLPGLGSRGRGGLTRGGNPYYMGRGGSLRGGFGGRGRKRGAIGYLPRYRGRGTRGGALPY